MVRSLIKSFAVLFVLLTDHPPAIAQDHVLTQLTFSDSTHDGYPYWSPDGNTIIYSSGTRSSCFTMKIPASGGTPEKLTDYFAQHARWSPSGEYIVFDGDFGTMLQMIPSTGGQPVRIDPDTIPIQMSGMPVWSPDGKQIAFKSLYTIYIMDLGTGDLFPLFRPEGKNAVPHDWSPDGDMILVDVRDTTDRSLSDLWLIPLEGAPKQLSFLPGRQVKPSISPDGAMVLFSSDHGGNADLWVLPAVGGNAVRLTFFEGDEENPGFDVEGSWSPNGKSIAFSSTRSNAWAIWRLEPDMDDLREQLFGKGNYTTSYPLIDPAQVPAFPTILQKRPDIPSPATSVSGREWVLVRSQDSVYLWFDATVENGSTLNYKESLRGKGFQLRVNQSDFPHLANTGLHSEEELNNTKSITGKTVSRITVDGRPGASSGAGFMAENETILSVLMADNILVKKLGLTHPDLARPLLQLWNISNERERYNETVEQDRRIEHKALIYNGKEVEVKISGSRGWQESIFNDEILGNYQLECWRHLDPEEESFLQKHYGHLPAQQMLDLEMMLTHLHTGEMVPYYINRYGFYEGHSDFRAEPLTIAFIFGLRSLEEIHKASGGDLVNYLTNQFTLNPSP